MAHDFAVRLALIAFATAAVQGLLTGAAFEPAVRYALAAGGVSYCLGWVTGTLARVAVEESVLAEIARALPQETVPATTGR